MNLFLFLYHQFILMKIKVIFCAISFLLIACETKNTSQEEDREHLTSLFEQIENIAFSQNCIDASDWKFTAYGSKACGGAKGYIAYSKKIDEVAFLMLVENYTNKEKVYNIKWGVISDCSLVNPPSSIRCENDLPVFEY